MCFNGVGFGFDFGEVLTGRLIHHESFRFFFGAVCVFFSSLEYRCPSVEVWKVPTVSGRDCRQACLLCVAYVFGVDLSECLLIGYVTCNVVRTYVESARVCSRRGAFSFLYAVHMNSAVTLRSGKAGRRRRLCLLFRG